MCGILAVLTDAPASISRARLDEMTDVVAHRGPDGRGLVCLAQGPQGLSPTEGDNWQVALGHRRLSILDLSEAGTQPMRYGAGLWITYNGEVYNYLELRRELEDAGHQFATRTDTEVVLAAYAEWGTDCFARMRGMWGLVLVDGPARRLVLSRDRLGIKPLYIARAGSTLAIASEPKQLKLLPGLEWRPDRQTLSGYLASGWERAGASFFDGIQPVPAGTWQTIDLNTAACSRSVSYWHPEEIEPTLQRPDEAAEKLRNLFLDSVRLHLRSDVPVGTALSGGLDSSAVAVGIRHVSEGSGGYHAFSALFPGHAIDESAFIEVAAQGSGAVMHQTLPTATGLVRDLDRFLWHHDEPVGSASQYAGYAVARLTREHGVSVSLNGQGGDEVFAGYWQAYFAHLAALGMRGRLVPLGRELLGALLPGGNGEALRQVPRMLRRFVSRRKSTLLFRSDVATLDDLPAKRALKLSATERRLWLIREFTLPRLLKWDDRNFMAFSVEGRYPFLDHELIETCLSFPDEQLYRGGWTKMPLRRALGDLLPRSIADRRTKVAFETPQMSWLKETMWPEVERLVGSESPLWEVVERSSARRLVEGVGASRRPRDEQAQAIMRLVFAHRWAAQQFG